MYNRAMYRNSLTAPSTRQHEGKVREGGGGGPSPDHLDDVEARTLVLSGVVGSHVRGWRSLIQALCAT